MKKTFLFSLVIVVTLSVFAFPADALRITLKRVIFEGAKRTEVITIINNSNEPETYRLGWRHFRMTSDTSLEAVPDDQLTPDIKPVVDMVRFAPRRVTIPAKSSQQVRMMLRIPAGLPDGEYRSHFWVKPEAQVESYRDSSDNGGTPRGGVSMQMLAGVTMPVIVRKGDLEGAAFVESLVATDTGGFFNVSWTLVREGERSLYGDIDYTCNPDSDARYVLKTTRGIAIYTELDRRNFNMRIEKPVDKPHCQTLAVSFSQADGFEGNRTVVLAEAKTQVNQ